MIATLDRARITHDQAEALCALCGHPTVYDGSVHLCDRCEPAEDGFGRQLGDEHEPTTVS